MKSPIKATEFVFKALRAPKGKCLSELFSRPVLARFSAEGLIEKVELTRKPGARGRLPVKLVLSKKGVNLAKFTLANEVRKAEGAVTRATKALEKTKREAEKLRAKFETSEPVAETEVA